MHRNNLEYSAVQLNTPEYSSILWKMPKQYGVYLSLLASPHETPSLFPQIVGKLHIYMVA